MTDGGKVNMPLIDVWMTKEEIADMFGLPEALVYRAIRSIYKKSELYEHEPSISIPSLGLFDTTNPVYDPAEEEFRRRMQKKKKKRGPRL